MEFKKIFFLRKSNKSAEVLCYVTISKTL